MDKEKQSKESTAQNGFINLINLSHEVTLTIFQTAVETQQATDKLVKNFIDSTVSYQEASTRLAKEYTDHLFKARREWTL